MRPRTTLFLSALFLSQLPVPGAWAQDVPPALERGIEVSAGLGVSRPMGKGIASDDHALSYSVPAMIPFTLGAGYRFGEYVYAGLLLGYGFGFTDHCPTGMSCSADSLVFGFEVRGYLPSGSSLPLWGSLGFAYESLDIGLAVGGLSAGGSLDGYQYLALKVGGDYRLARQFAIAPYLGFDLARFGGVSSGGRSQSIPDDQQSWHMWWTLGARCAYTFGL